jgi:putative transposase
MANKKIVLVTNEFYHIFNNTVANEVTFSDKRNLNRALSLVDFYRFQTSLSYSHFQNLPKEEREKMVSVIYSSTPIVEIYCLAFMPNHHHFLLKQLQDNGIDDFISNLQNGFAKFYNKKLERKGSLFCHSFKRVRIETEEQFIHVSRYIHLNPVTSCLIKIEELDVYPYTSFPVYLGEKRQSFVETSYILNHFKTVQRYKKFVYDQSDYQKKLNKIKNLVIEII